MNSAEIVSNCAWMADMYITGRQNSHIATANVAFLASEVVSTMNL